jgi:hypothetical protein
MSTLFVSLPVYISVETQNRDIATLIASISLMKVLKFLRIYLMSRKNS